MDEQSVEKYRSDLNTMIEHLTWRMGDAGRAEIAERAVVVVNILADALTAATARAERAERERFAYRSALMQSDIHLVKLLDAEWGQEGS